MIRRPESSSFALARHPTPRAWKWIQPAASCHFNDQPSCQELPAPEVVDQIHHTDLHVGPGYPDHAQEALNHYGLAAFRFDFIACATSLKSLELLEMRLIAQYDSTIKGYNQTRGGAVV